MQHTSSQTSPEHSIHEVAPGIWQLTVPIPFPLKTVNMYALVDPSGWVLIDTAIGTPEVRRTLYASLQHVGLQLSMLRAIVVTHNHPDHIGLTGELHEQSGAPVYMHTLDITSLYDLWGDGAAQQVQHSLDFFALHGFQAEEPWYTQISNSERQRILTLPPREAIVELQDGQRIELAQEVYRVIWTPGHSDGQVCLFRERDGVFVSADHVLARITPNIGLYSFAGRPDPLADYIHSLHKVESLPVQLTLPGHGPVFTEPQLRIAEIIEHHQHRLQQILELLAPEPQQANQLMEQLFHTRLQDSENRRFALAEVVAHLEFLYFRGKIARQQTEAGILYSVVL